jgi:hypothetical protein
MMVPAAHVAQSAQPLPPSKLFEFQSRAAFGSCSRGVKFAHPTHSFPAGESALSMRIVCLCCLCSAQNAFTFPQ